MGFNAQEFVEDCIAEGVIDFRDMAESALSTNPPREFILECIGEHLRVIIGASRRSNGGGYAVEKSKPEPSRRWQSYRDYILARVCHVPGEGSKQIGDLGASDCEAIAEFHGKIAASNAKQSAGFRSLAKACKSRKCKVNRLPMEIIESVFGSEQ